MNYNPRDSASNTLGPGNTLQQYKQLNVFTAIDICDGTHEES